MNIFECDGVPAGDAREAEGCASIWSEWREGELATLEVDGRTLLSDYVEAAIEREEVGVTDAPDGERGKSLSIHQQPSQPYKICRIVCEKHLSRGVAIKLRIVN